MKVFLAVMLAAVGALSTAAHAAPIVNDIESRINSRTITFSDLTFADAVDNFQSTMTVVGSLGETGSFQNAQKTGLQNYGTQSGAGISLSGLVTPDSSNGFNGQLSATITRTSERWFSFGGTYQAVTPTPGFSASSLVRSTSDGYNTLEFQTGGGGFVKPGGAYSMYVLINGNWSQQGVGEGKAQLHTLNAAWTITQNFVYDAVNDRTVFEAVNSSYVDGTSPGLDFVLYGQSLTPVPLPAGAWLLLSALGLIRLAVKRNGINVTA